MTEERVLGPIAIIALGLVCASCTDLFPLTASRTSSAAPQGDKARQALCDVERSRARDDALKQFDVEIFRQAALKVSQALTADEISDLVRLTPPPSDPSTNRSPDWEVDRQRDQLVAQIYTDAIERAGDKQSDPQAVAGNTALTYTTDVDASATDGPYAEFLVGQLSKTAPPAGAVAEVGLAALPDQSRYYVDVYTVSRYEIAADGTQQPVYDNESLYENASETIPRSCDGVSTELDLGQFNTVPGLGSASGS